MATVLIKIEDQEDGGCLMSASSDPDISPNDDECTPAQIAGAMVMKLMDAMLEQAKAEGEGE